MSLELVNEDFVMTKTPNGSWVIGTPTYIKQLSTKSKLNSKFILRDVLSWTMAGCTLTGYNFVSGGGSINKTAMKVKCEGLFPLRKTDNGQCNGSFTRSSPAPTTVNCNCNFNITNAGQIKVKCE